MSRFAVTVLVLAGLGAGLLVPRAARACSFGCRPPDLLFHDRTLPASIPALGVSHGQPPTAVLTKDGAAVPLSITEESSGGRVFLLVPAAPLAEGEHRLTLNAPCAGSSPPQEATFHVSGARPLPTSLGTVRADVRSGDVYGSVTGADCGSVQHAGVIAALTIAPSADLAAFAATTRYTTKVDGVEWATSAYGDLGPPRTGNPYYDAADRRVDRVEARCSCDPSSEACGAAVLQGRHHVEVSAHVAGATSDPPPVAVDVDLSCPDADGGCAVTRSSSPLDVTWLGGLGAVLAAVRYLRKRTTRRCDHRSGTT